MVFLQLLHFPGNLFLPRASCCFSTSSHMGLQSLHHLLTEGTEHGPPRVAPQFSTAEGPRVATLHSWLMADHLPLGFPGSFLHDSC